jgi:hypothetical protein
MPVAAPVLLRGAATSDRGDHRGLITAVAIAVAAVAGYAVAWRDVAGVAGVRWGRAVLVVLAGFGAHLPAGGLAIDRRALERRTGDGRHAVVHALGLGALEYGAHVAAWVGMAIYWAAALMSLALGWVGIGLAAAVAYRAVNVVLPAVPALWAHRRLELA